MTGQLTDIIRHPIKSIGWEELASAVLTAGAVLPFDRRWAVSHEAAEFGTVPTGWHAKRNFVRGVAGPELMAVRACLLEGGNRIRLTHPRRPEIEIAPDTSEGSAALIEWLAPVWPQTRPAAAQLVSRPEQAMTDVPDPFVAILSHASRRAFGQRLGKDLSIHRFRGNLWIDGFAPWEEFDWMGREIRIGSARLRIEEPITRCNATKVNPETGKPDTDTLGALEAAYGHRNFGVYATVLDGGEVQRGDRVELP